MTYFNGAVQAVEDKLAELDAQIGRTERMMVMHRDNAERTAKDVQQLQADRVLYLQAIELLKGTEHSE